MEYFTYFRSNINGYVKNVAVLNRGVLIKYRLLRNKPSLFSSKEGNVLFASSCLFLRE